jgi:hypothetical protein
MGRQKSLYGKDYFYFPKLSDQLCRPPSLRFTGHSFSVQGLKWSRRELNHSPSSSAEIQMIGLCVCFPYMPSWRGQQLRKFIYIRIWSEMISRVWMCGDILSLFLTPSNTGFWLITRITSPFIHRFAVVTRMWTGRHWKHQFSSHCSRQ